MNGPPADGYPDDLAYIHNVGFTAYTERLMPGLLALLRRAGICDGLVVDLGCGGGQWARRLCDEGYDVLGIDLSTAMITEARRRAPGARFEVASFLDARIPPCVAVTSLGECLNYLFDPRNQRRVLRGFFRRVHDALHPGGLFLFDVAVPGQVTLDRPRQRHSQGPDWAVMVDVEEDATRRLLKRYITTFRQVREGLYRRETLIHRQRLYLGPEMLENLRRAGFRARASRSFGPSRLPPAHLALIARKPLRANEPSR